MERFRQDLGFGFRSLLRQPGTTILVVLMLAVTIGANVTMLSFAQAILVPALPYEKPDRLILVERRNDAPGSSEVSVTSLPAVADWRKSNRVFAGSGLLYRDHRNLTGQGGDPERIESLLVSHDLLETLGMKPHRGRGFLPEDDQIGAERTVMLTYRCWRQRFGGDTEILGRSLLLDNLSYKVIGILPQGLHGQKLGNTSLGELWLPIRLFYDELMAHDRRVQYDYVPIGRLKSGVDVREAREDLARISQELAVDYPDTDQNRTLLAMPVREHLVGHLKPMVLALKAALIFVLLIACANMMHILLARFVERQREFAIREAMGAHRGHLISQGFCEVFALALVGGTVGVLASFYLVRALPSVLEGVPYADQARLSPIILLYALGLCFLVTLITGLIPVLQTISPFGGRILARALGSRSTLRNRNLRRILILGEIALAVVLVTGTGLALTTYFNLRDEDMGLSVDRALTLEVALPLLEYREITDWTGFFDQALTRVGALPGVKAAAVTNDLPMGLDYIISGVLAGDRAIPRPDQRQRTIFYTVSPDFFRAMGIPLLEGRVFSSGDRFQKGAHQIVVVSQKLAKTFWPDRSAVGQKIGFEFPGGTMENPEVLWREIVGVVADVRYQGVQAPLENALYVPYTQRPFWYGDESPKMAFVIRTEQEPSALAEEVRRELLKIDSDQPVFGVRSMKDILEAQLQRPKMVFLLLSSFAAVAVVLALIGVYGVISLMVAARTREIGIRLAIGASPSQVLLKLLCQIAVWIALGTVFGLLGAGALLRVMAGLLYGVEPFEPLIYLVGGLALMAVALCASSIPVARAAHIDPARTLRWE